MENKKIIKGLGYFLLIFNIILLPFSILMLSYYLYEDSFPFILKIMGIISLFANFLNLFLGFGIIMLREWARKLYVYFSIFGLVTSPVFAFIAYYFRLLEVSNIVGAMLGVVISFTVLRYFIREDIKRIFR